MTEQRPAPCAQQHGMALLVVMVVLVLGSLMALGTARTSWLNEHLVSSQSDQQRAQAAAEALLKDAQDDIRGQRADGTPCSTDPADAGCRGARAGDRPFFPRLGSELPELAARIGPGQDCRHGICLPASVTSLNPRALATRLEQAAAAGTPDTLAARHGQYTGAPTSQALLSGATPRAWYWVEVFEVDSAAPAGPALVYRINAYAQGRKTGTRVLLRSVFVPPPVPLNVPVNG